MVYAEVEEIRLTPPAITSRRVGPSPVLPLPAKRAKPAASVQAYPPVWLRARQIRPPTLRSVGTVQSRREGHLAPGSSLQGNGEFLLFKQVVTLN